MGAVKFDPVRLEIFKNKFTAIAEEMGHVIKRTATTAYVAEVSDFATALATPDGEFFGYPLRVGVTAYVNLNIAGLIRAFDHYEEGDVVVTNDPYLSGAAATQLPDVTFIKPIFWAGRPICYAFTFCHATDVGGKVPGSVSPTAWDVWQEGVRIPPTKIYKAGVLNTEFVNWFKANSRMPEDNWGDMRALLAAMNTAEERIHELIARYGVGEVTAAFGAVLDYARAKAERIIAGLPKVTATFVDYLDDDHVSNVPVRLQVTLTIGEREIHLDYTGSDPQVPAAFNIPTLGRPHPWITFRLASLFYTIDPLVPFNAGLLRPVRVTLPLTSVVNPEFPGAFGVRFATALRSNEAILGALAKALPGRIPAAGGGSMVPLTLAEPDFASGRRRVFTIQALLGGTGASPGRDGVDARNCELASLNNNPVELVEKRTSIIVRQYGIRPDSGGPGAWRGGSGAVFEFQCTRAGSVITARGMERHRFQPWGLAGGGPGAAARTILNPGTADERELGRIDAVILEPGDVVRVYTAGGGGYGDPLQRDPALVAADVAQGYVTPAGAESEYGVVFRDDATMPGRLAVDLPATLARRQEMAAGGARTGLCPARTAYERVWTEEAQAALRAILFAQPVDVRRWVRDRLVAMACQRFPDQPLTAAQIAALWAELSASVGSK